MSREISPQFSSGVELGEELSGWGEVVGVRLRDVEDMRAFEITADRQLQGSRGIAGIEIGPHDLGVSLHEFWIAVIYLARKFEQTFSRVGVGESESNKGRIATA